MLFRNTETNKEFRSVLFKMVAGSYALGKAYIMRAIPSLRHFPNVAFETVPMFV